MPVYQYACTQCGSQLEVRQSFSDDPLTVCPQCEGPLRKVLSGVGVVFKGSGFYRTDSRTSSTSNGSESSGVAASDGGTTAGEKAASAPKGDSATSSTSKTPSGDSSTAKASSPASS